MRNPTYQCADLHSHSRVSDGSLTPTELVERASACGVTALALTDHDTLDGLPEATEAARQNGIHLVPGIELSVRYDNREIHLVGLWVDTNEDQLLCCVEAQQNARQVRARKIGARLDKAAGLANSYEKACELANSTTPGRPWFAKMLVQQGKVRNQQHAFSRFLKQGQSAFVRTPWCSMEEGIAAIHAAGGTSVIAHPHAYGMTRKRLRKLVSAFKEAGGDAIELAMPGLTPPQRERLEECCLHFELQASAGSDFHSPAQKWLELGRLPTLPPDCRPVWEGR